MLRDFQQGIKRDTFAAWNEGAINVMAVSPTGSGKTVIVGDIIQTVDAPTAAIAHRQELVGQLALALNRENVPHGIVAPKGIIQQIIALEMETHGYSRYSARAPTRACGIDTLIRRNVKDKWFDQLQLAVIDEGHHVLANNKWGKALLMMPNARGLFPTAHAIRADGCGLGRGQDGLVDKLVVGPCGRDLINRGFLTDYRLICPESDIDLSEVPVGTMGDYNQPKLRIAVHKSKTRVGHMVRHYLKYAPGKLGITFAVDVEDATDFAKEYRARGVPAEVITADTPLAIRGALMRKFRLRQILMLVSVDVLGEGVDVPAIEVVLLGRPTASFQLHAQQRGRLSRIMVADHLAACWNDFTDAERLLHIAQSVKPKGLIIDAVGNEARFFEEHNFADSRQSYTLNRRDKSTRGRAGDGIPLRTCLECLQPYEAIKPVCPYCSTRHVPQGRARPDQVDGDLFELSPEVLASMRAAVAKIDEVPSIPVNAGAEIANSILKHFRDKRTQQATLREVIQLWAGWQRHLGREDAEIYRRFYYRFSIDILSAQALGVRDAWELETKIYADLAQHNVVSAAA